MNIKYITSFFVVALIGLLSRLIPFESGLLNKYLGDALYAIEIYIVLRIFLNKQKFTTAIISFVIVLLIEIFQITGIPLSLVYSENIVLRLSGRILGTQFSFIDIFYYALGLIIFYQIDTNILNKNGTM